MGEDLFEVPLGFDAKAFQDGGDIPGTGAVLQFHQREADGAGATGAVVERAGVPEGDELLE